MIPAFEAAKFVNDTIADVTSVMDGLFDVSLSPSSDETAEETEFRRRMQCKKKKGRRMQTL